MENEVIYPNLGKSTGINLLKNFLGQTNKDKESYKLYYSFEKNKTKYCGYLKKETAIENLAEVIKRGGIEKGITIFSEIKKDGYKTFCFLELKEIKQKLEEILKNTNIEVYSEKQNNNI